jgi:hypothetical protein
VLNVRINVAALDDRSLGTALIEEAAQLVARTADAAGAALTAVNAAIDG